MIIIIVVVLIDYWDSRSPTKYGWATCHISSLCYNDTTSKYTIAKYAW